MILLLWVVSGAILLAATLFERRAIASGERSQIRGFVAAAVFGGSWGIWLGSGAVIFHAP